MEQNIIQKIRAKVERNGTISIHDVAELYFHFGESHIVAQDLGISPAAVNACLNEFFRLQRLLKRNISLEATRCQFGRYGDDNAIPIFVE